MKELFENWRKLGKGQRPIREGEVIPFPTREPEPVEPPEPTISDEDIERIVNFEDNIGKLLGNLYGNQAEIPIYVLERMEDLVMSVEDTFIK